MILWSIESTVVANLHLNQVDGRGSEGRGDLKWILYFLKTFKKKVETDLKVRIGGGDCEGSLAESISRISLMLSGRFEDQDR